MILKVCLAFLRALVPTTVVKPVTKKLLSDIKFANKVLSKKYAGKIVYASTGSGKTSIVRNFDNVVDGDVIQIDLIRDFLNKQLINGPHVVVDQSQARTLKDRMDKALASNNPKDRDDAIKSLIYDFTVLMNQSHTTSMAEFRRDVITPAFKDAARQGKTVLTGSNFAKEIADFVFLQRNRLISSVAMADMAPTKGNAVVAEIDNFLSEYILEGVDSLANSKDVHINTSSTSSYQVKQDLSDTIVAKPETSEAGDVTEAPSSEAANEAKNNMDSPRREFKKKGIQLGSSSGIIERARLAQNKAKDKSDDVKPKLAHSNAEKWNKREELEWLRRVLPNVPVRSLDNIKHVLSHGVEYWGAFYDAAIYLATNPGRGTGYHEAFHAVWNLYLTEDNKLEIQKAAESDSKFVKNYAIGKKITEESFANAFQDYMVERKKESIPSKILRFFKEIIMLARALAKRPIKNHEELFYRINLGSFRSGVKVSDKLVSKSLKTKVAGWSYAFQNEIIADLTKHIFKDIIPSVRSEDPRLSNKTDIEILNYIASVHGKESIYDAMYNNLIDLRNSGVITDQAILTNIDRTIELIDTGVLIPEIERYMAANVGIDMRGDFFKGVKFDSDENTVALEEERVKEGWQFEHTSVSAKDRAPIRVKNFIRFMDGGTMSPLGLQGRVDFDVTYNTLLSNLEGARTSTEIEQFLIENLPFHPEYQEILDEFRRDPSFKTAFFLAFQNTHTKYLVVSKMQRRLLYSL